MNSTAAGSSPSDVWQINHTPIRRLTPQNFPGASLRTGCWLLAAFCWLLAAGCWLLAAAGWVVAAAGWVVCLAGGGGSGLVFAESPRRLLHPALVGPSAGAPGGGAGPAPPNY